MMKFFLNSLSIIFLPVWLNAQSVFSWQQCVEYAWENNLSINKQELLTRYQQLSVKEARHMFLPSVSGYADYNQNSGRSIDKNTNDIINQNVFYNNYNLSGSITLFEGFLRTNRLKYEKYIYSASIENYNAQKSEIAFAVIDAYFQALFYQGMYEISNEQVSTSQKELDRINKKEKLGQASLSDVMEIEAFYASDKYTLVKSEVDKIKALHTLKRTMNYPVIDNLVIEIPNNIITVDSINRTKTDDVLELAKLNLPEVQMLEYNLNAAQKRLAQARGYISPRITLSSGWSSGYYETVTDNSGILLPFNKQINGNMEQYVRLSMSIPLFNRLNNYTNTQKAKVNYEIAKNDYENALINIEYEVHENILDLEAAKKQYDASSKNVEKQVVAFQTAEKKISAGLIDIIDYHVIKNQLAYAKAENLRASLELFLTYTTINYYIMGEIL